MALKTKKQLEKECVDFKKRNAELEENIASLKIENENLPSVLEVQKKEIQDLRQLIELHESAEVKDAGENKIPVASIRSKNPFVEIAPGVMAYNVGRARDTGVVLYFPVYDQIIHLPKGNIISDKKGHKLI